MSTELVLIVSDLFIPLRTPDIDTQFKSILVPNKVQHVLCLGNIGNQETYDWLNGLSEDFHEVKGDYDIYNNISEKKAVQIGNFRIGMIHGHQIIPAGDLEVLANIQRELDCDILVSGYTHQLSINAKEKRLYLNPGSLSGSLSPMLEDCVPSFILLALQGEDATIFSYVLNDKNQKFEVGQIEYLRTSNELKIVKQIGEDIKENDNYLNNENNIDKENNNNNIENEVKKENEELKENEEQIKNEEQKEKVEQKENIEKNELIQNNEQNSTNQNQSEEIKEAENKDEKIDE